MDKRVKVWWLALADQYEEWAEEPPVNRWGGGAEYTCDALNGRHNGWGFTTAQKYPGDVLVDVWREWYGPTSYPAGSLFEYDRPERLKEFCLTMAETIRENVQ